MIEKLTEKLTFDFVSQHALGTLKVLRVLGVGLPILGGLLLFWNWYVLGSVAIVLATLLNIVALSVLTRILNVPASIAKQIGVSADLQNNLMALATSMMPALGELLNQAGTDGEE